MNKQLRGSGLLVIASLLAMMVLPACAGAATAVPSETPPAAVSAAPAATPQIVASAPTPTAAHNYSWAMVTFGGCLGDQGFDDLAYKGLNMAAQQFGGAVKVVCTTEQAQLVPNFTALAQSNADLIVAVGSETSDALNTVASQFPNIHFALVDGSLDQPNVAGIVFREQEGSFLGGIMAGSMSKTGVIGFVAGENIPPVIRWQSGFEAGVLTVNPKANILTNYLGNWSDPAKGKEAATTMYNSGADIIFESAGGSAFGVYDTAKALGKGYWVYGPDTCKYQLAPDNVLPDVVKNVDVGVFTVAQQVAEGAFKGGASSLGLKEGAVGMCQQRYTELVPADVRAKIDAATKLIVSGQLVVPDSLDKVKTFTPPNL